LFLDAGLMNGVFRKDKFDDGFLLVEDPWGLVGVGIAFLYFRSINAITIGSIGDNFAFYNKLFQVDPRPGRIYGEQL